MARTLLTVLTASALIGALASLVGAESHTEVLRIAARRVEGGYVEFALIEEDGSFWYPPARFLDYREAEIDVWYRSSPYEVTPTVAVAPPPPTTRAPEPPPPPTTTTTTRTVRNPWLYRRADDGSTIARTPGSDSYLVMACDRSSDIPRFEVYLEPIHSWGFWGAYAGSFTVVYRFWHYEGGWPEPLRTVVDRQAREFGWRLDEHTQRLHVENSVRLAELLVRYGDVSAFDVTITMYRDDDTVIRSYKWQYVIESVDKAFEFARCD